MAIEASAAKILNHLAESSDCPIAKLADEDLAAIFKELPPFERLIVSEVCVKWQDVSQAAWRDVSHLDLSKVPTQNIHAVIRKCPSLTSVSARNQNLGDLGRFASRLSGITSLKCVDCTFTTISRITHQQVLRDCIRSASSWEELIWHNSKTTAMESEVPTHEYLLPLANPSALKRLQMSALNLPKVVHGEIRDAMYGLSQLECFILADIYFPQLHPTHRYVFYCSLYRRFSGSAVLRELYLDAPPGLSPFVRLAFSFPALKILYLNSASFKFQPLNFTRLITEHPSLCILVLTASRPLEIQDDDDDTLIIPARKRFPNGFDAPPVPQLHLFLGKVASEKLRFQPSTSDALKIYPIDAPLPEFLEKQEIAKTFEGSWVTSRIKEGARDGVHLADYSSEGNAVSIVYEQH